jgi:ferredoxin-type protein NapG
VAGSGPAGVRCRAVADDKYDRKTLFKKGFSWLGDAIARTVERRLDIVPRSHIRPPGALVESLFLSTCDGSGRCVSACPYGAIRLSGPPGAHTDGTPVISPTNVPCYLCTDVPCAKACPSGALVPLARDAIKIGLAVVNESACFAHQGAECGECLTACPVGPAALVKEGKGPKVIADGCTGCGMCTNVCPTRPRAIRIRPL